MAKTHVPHNGAVVSRAEAKASGLKRYFTGEPCRHGHTAERTTDNATCIACANLTKARWAQKNPDYSAEYAKANTEAALVRVREWVAKNPEKARANKEAYRRANEAMIKQRDREWQLQNPVRKRAISRNYRARRAAAEGNHTAEEVAALLKRQNGRCAYCRVSIRDSYHADHITPLKRGGSNWISNIQLTCAPCNHRKNAADPVDFARRVGLLI